MSRRAVRVERVANARARPDVEVGRARWSWRSTADTAAALTDRSKGVEHINGWMNVVRAGGIWTLLAILLGQMLMTLVLGRFSKKVRRSRK